MTRDEAFILAATVAVCITTTGILGDKFMTLQNKVEERHALSGRMQQHAEQARHRFQNELAQPFYVVSSTGPSRERYAQLLHECRASNREHLRLLKEYEKNPAIKSHPEQMNGSVEFGTAGF